MKKLLFLAFVATFFSNNTIAGNICAGTRQQKQQKTILPAHASSLNMLPTTAKYSRYTQPNKILLG